MRRSTYLSLIGVTAVLGGVATPTLAATCADAQFSQAVLDRFPNIRKVCSEVIEKDGQQYAVVKGDLVRTGNNSVYMKFETKPDFRVKIDGQPTRVRDLAVGQELTAYVKVSDPVIALEPAVATDPIDAYPMEAAAPMMAANEAEMPRTAGPMPLVAGLGGLLLALGGALTFVRSRRAS
jgi:hypothetical protein